MSIKIHEDMRTLREFYPDPTTRHQVHYGYAHLFLPQYFGQNPVGFFARFCQDTPGGAADPTRFIQSNWNLFEERAGLVEADDDILNKGMLFRRVSDLSLSLCEIAGRPVGIVKMPTPELPPEAFFVAVVLDGSQAGASAKPHEVKARVFTVELGTHEERPDEGVVCEWTEEGEHHNLGLGIRAESNAFLQAVTSVLEAPAAPFAGGFKPPQQGSVGSVTVSAGSDASPPMHPRSEKRNPWWKIW